MLLFISVLMTGCGDGGGSSDDIGNNTQADTFTLTLSEIRISRSADQLDMPVIGIPIEGAVLTVQ